MMSLGKAAIPLLSGFIFSTVALGQDSAWNPVGPRPLEQAALFFQARYHKAVTYEDPLWPWIADSEFRGWEAESPTARWLSNQFLDLPTEVITGQTTKFDASLVQRIIRAYHDQNPADTRFRLVESSLGLHIVPALAHDENGKLVEVTSLLDTAISVPTAVRMPSEHLGAICAAISQTSGVKVINGEQWMDQFFAPNGAVPRRFLSSTGAAEEKAPYSFEWGASNESARAALIRLLEPSATTLSWALLCQPNLNRQSAFCVLNLNPIVITTIDSAGKHRTSLSYDRCGKCEFLNGRTPKKQ